MEPSEMGDSWTVTRDFVDGNESFMNGEGRGDRHERFMHRLVASCALTSSVYADVERVRACRACARMSRCECMSRMHRVETGDRRECLSSTVLTGQFLATLPGPTVRSPLCSSSCVSCERRDQRRRRRGRRARVLSAAGSRRGAACRTARSRCGSSRCLRWCSGHRRHPSESRRSSRCTCPPRTCRVYWACRYRSRCDR
jgi:hypothetical protein